MKIINIVYKRSVVVLLFAVCISMVGCRLDSFLYSPLETTEYKLEAFEDAPHFTLDSSYTIPDSLIHLMTLESGPADDRETIYAVYVGSMSKISQDTVILYCHGNAGNMDYYWERVKLLANAGGKNRFGVMFMDYRGYGMSTGEPTETGMYYDVDACMQWLKSKGLTNDRFIMEGFSLGCAPSCELTANPRSLQPSKIILEAPFASFQYLAQDIGKISIAGSWYSDLEVDNAVEIQKIDEPFLWIHGEADDFIGVHHGALVYSKYQGTHSVARRVAGGGHSTVPLVMGFDVYMDLIADFITGEI